MHLTAITPNVPEKMVCTWGVLSLFPRKLAFFGKNHSLPSQPDLMALSPRKHNVKAEYQAANILSECLGLHKVTLFSKVQHVPKMASATSITQQSSGEMREMNESYCEGGV